MNDGSIDFGEQKGICGFFGFGVVTPLSGISLCPSFRQTNHPSSIDAFALLHGLESGVGDFILDSATLFVDELLQLGLQVILDEAGKPMSGDQALGEFAHVNGG